MKIAFALERFKELKKQIEDVDHGGDDYVSELTVKTFDNRCRDLVYDCYDSQEERDRLVRRLEASRTRTTYSTAKARLGVLHVEVATILHSLETKLLKEEEEKKWNELIKEHTFFKNGYARLLDELFELKEDLTKVRQSAGELRHDLNLDSIKQQVQKLQHNNRVQKKLLITVTYGFMSFVNYTVWLIETNDWRTVNYIIQGILLVIYVFALASWNPLKSPKVKSFSWELIKAVVIGIVTTLAVGLVIKLMKIKWGIDIPV
jgi:hypothetical protein